MAIGDMKAQMNKEIAALKKKRDAGKLTDFKFRQGVRKIKQKYGKSAPSNVSRILTYISTKSPADAIRDFAPKLLEPSPRSAKAVADKKKAAAKKKAAEQTARSDRQLIKKAKTAEARKTPRDAPKKSPPKKRAAPKFNPSGLKVPAKKKAAPKKQKMFTAINVRTGKPDFNKPKVTAAERLKQEDKYKAYKRIERAAKSSMKKKKRG